MSDFVPECDLLGDPIVENWRGRGRPQHVPTTENRLKIKLLLAQGWTDMRIAGALGITPPTLRKHYFSVLRLRDTARDQVEATGLATLWSLGRSGNVAAMKEYFRRHDAVMGDIFDDEVEKAREKVGKKAQTKIEAGNPPEDWDELLPQTMN